MEKKGTFHQLRKLTVAPLDTDDDGWKLVPHYGKKGFKCQQKLFYFDLQKNDNFNYQTKRPQIDGKNQGKLNHIRHKYFPLKDRNSPAVAFDDDGLTYLTPHWIADQITDWIMCINKKKTICNFSDLFKCKMEKEPQVFIDGTAGLGGHVLSFGLKTHVPSIYGIELDKQRFEVMAGKK